MKNYLTSILILCFPFFINTQTTIEWDASGASWLYRVSSMSSVEYMKFQSAGDTLINGQTVKKIDVSRISFYNTNPIQGRTEEFLHTEYMYFSGGSVFRYQDGGFVLVYDFGAQTGDVWTITGNEDHACHQFATQAIDMIVVESIDSEQFGAYELEVIDVIQNEHWSLGEKIIRGIGSTKTMFPEQVGCGNVIDGGLGYLQSLDCYYNDELGFVGISTDTQFCFDLITDNEGVIQEETGAIFPNPAATMICFPDNYTNKNYQIKIFNTQGKLHLHQQNITENIDIHHLPSGVYLVNIVDGNQIIYTQKIVKM